MLGKLEKVNIRDIWKNEPSDFTKWLSEEKNLALLSEEIGIEIKFLKKEASVGDFSADILGEEENTGRKIIIENQLEITDHDHLGKLITYASGYDVDILIWIFKNIREEHRKAIDWLNERTDDTLNIFAIKMELWKIGDSSPAPKFQIISSPNDWAKAVKQSSSQNNLTETNLLQLNFWTAFNQYLGQNSQKLRAKKPRPQHWCDLSIGNSQAYISLVISFQKNFIRAGLYIPNNKDLFLRLVEQKQKIEKNLGLTLEWMELPKAKASRINLQKNNINLKNKDNYEECFKWFTNMSEKFIDVFPKYF